MWQYTNPLGIEIPFAVFDNPPPAGAAWLGITYRPASDSGAAHWLNITSELASKWLVWTKKLPPSPPPPPP